MEDEWYSQCCSAPPLYGVNVEEGIDIHGICMSCREHASFEIIEEEE